MSWARVTNAVLELAGDGARLLAHAEMPWSSITFAGTRHTLTLSFAGDQAVTAGEAFIAAIGEHEFDLRGQLVADAQVVWTHLALVPEPRLDTQVELLILDHAAQEAA